MRCSKCGSDNREGAKFCNDCGTPLGTKCAACEALNQAGAKFCDECGAALIAGVFTKATAVQTALTSPASGERRHLTVLFCDLVGSTEIAARLDPEEWREIVASYHRAAAEAISRFGGYVAQYQGDGVMAYFGWPEAHDNNAERAARAGLAILAAISKLNVQSTPKLSARVGIDSGAVVVGVGAGKKVDVFGDTPNIAARVQAVARPHTVLITADTHRLISGLFVVEDGGAQALKGIERPIQLYRVIQPSGVRGRLEAAAAARGLTPFVGREDELRLLMNRWERTLGGEGQVVLINGEAGVGKSRLVHEFRKRIAGTPHAWAQAAASPFLQNTPFHTIADAVRALQQSYIDALGWVGYLEAQRRSRRRTSRVNVPQSNGEPTNGAFEDQLQRLMSALDIDFDPSLIIARLSIAASAEHPGVQFVSGAQRRRLLSALTEWVLDVAQIMPVVIAIEDLHLTDPSSLELIELVIQQCARVPLILLHTARPEFRVGWHACGHFTQITLDSLNPDDARAMVESVAEQKALPLRTITTVVKRTGGVPLFVEELTRAVLESGGTEHAGGWIPATLHDSLMARLDRLGAARETLQIGAVLGTEFTYELLQAVSLLDQDDLQRHLLALTQAGLIYERDLPPKPNYQFKHALIRDAAYEALLRSRRKELHLRTAEILERQFPDQVTSEPELLAHHYTEAGLIEQSIHYWHQAGERALQRSANTEAISHFARGLELLKSAPDSHERIQQELTLQMSLGGALTAISGYAAPEAGKAYGRALELCEQGGQTRQTFSILGPLAGFYLIRGDLQKARQLVEQLLSQAQELQSPAGLQSAHYGMGEVLFRLGDLSKALKHLKQAIDLYKPDMDAYVALPPRRTGPQLFAAARRLRLLQDPGVACLAIAARTLWCLGYPNQAVKKIQESIALAQDLSHPFSLAFALDSAATVYQHGREVEATQKQAEALIALSQEQGFTLREKSGVTLRGWALAKHGRSEEGIAQIRHGLEATQEAGGEIWQPEFLALLAEACGEAGQAKEGLAALAVAFDLASRVGYAVIEPVLQQLKGELLLKLDDFHAAEAETCFQRAIEVARIQSAKSRELRATLSLARLLAKQAHRDEARTMLAEVYNWFTEGFDTPDLRDAEALLYELGNSRS
jgi:class 3 adenylate cyclase/predicted ATPase